MRSKAFPSYLFKSQNDVFYFRIRIPKSVKRKYNTSKIEIKKSLRTKDISLATKKARHLWVLLENTDYTLKNNDYVVQKRNYDNNFLTAETESIESITQDFKGNGEKVINDGVDKSIKISPTKGFILKKKRTKSSPPQFKDNGSDNFQFSNFSSELVSQKIDEYLEQHFEEKRRVGNPAPDNTIKEYQGIFRRFIAIIGKNLKCCDLNKDIIKNYSKTIWNLPANYRRKSKYRKKSINQILKMNIPENEKVSPVTFNKNIMRVKKFLKWAENEDFIPQGLNVFLRYVPDKSKANEKKDKFTGKELNLLFNNEIYERHMFKNPSRYFLPLLALFTGARGQELAQLYKDDIITDGNVPYIRIRANEERKQRIKNKSAARIVPIHKKLIEIGFLDFVEKSKNESLLFPDLEDSKGNYFKKFGNNFNRKSKNGWKWKCGVKNEKTSFHSFRHNVIDFLAKSDGDKKDICFIVGHEFNGQGLVLNYIKTPELDTLWKTINLLKFPSIDWDKIKKKNW